MKLHLLAGAVALAVSGAASAVSFDFTNSNGIATRHDSLTYNVGGVGLTVTPTGNSTKVSSYWEGLGAYSRSPDLDTFDDCCLGNNASRDQLVFTFNTAVTISGISFRQWENNIDRVRFIGGGFDFNLSNSGSSGLVDYFVFNTPITLTSFTLQALNDASTAVYVHGLQGVTAVPLPAAGWLLGSGLLGLTGLARRRRA